MSELETIIDQLSDAALLEMVESDPALLVLQAAALADAAIEARGGRAALKSRLTGEKAPSPSGTSDPSAAPAGMETSVVSLAESPMTPSPVGEAESQDQPAAREELVDEPLVESGGLAETEVNAAATQLPPGTPASDEFSTETDSPAPSTGADPTLSAPASLEESELAEKAAELEEVRSVNVIETTEAQATEVDEVTSQESTVTQLPEQPVAEEGEPTVTAGVEEVVSAADIDAILAAAGSAPEKPDGTQVAESKPIPAPDAGVTASPPVPGSDVPTPSGIDEMKSAETSDAGSAPAATSNTEDVVSAADIDAILAAAGGAQDNSDGTQVAEPEPIPSTDAGVPPSPPVSGSDSPTQPASADSGSAAKSDASAATVPPANAGEVASAADIDAILAASVIASADAGSPAPEAAKHGDPTVENSDGESSASTSAAPSAPGLSGCAEASVTPAGAPSADELASPPDTEPATVVAESDRASRDHHPSSTRCSPKYGRTSRKRRTAVTAAVLVIVAALGALADRRWLRQEAVPVEAREGKAGGLVAALESCHALYEATASVTRPPLMRSFAKASRRRDSDTEESFIQTVGELRITQADRIAAFQAAFGRAKTEFAELTQHEEVPAALVADFEKFSVIVNRHSEFLGTRQPPQAFEQWFNDYERMTAIYRRLRKELDQIKGM